MTDLQALHDSTHTMVMGVLNITEDSSSDGGLWLDPAKAAQHGRDMMAAGADIIDIGAESTRPGAKRVSEADELVRITGAVKTLIPAGAILSIDTTRASVAAAALSEGAQIINDVSGGTLDAELPHVVADHDCLYVPDNFLLEKEKVSFLYNKYDIAPYAVGIITLSLPYTSVEKYMIH